MQSDYRKIILIRGILLPEEWYDQQTMAGLLAFRLQRLPAPIIQDSGKGEAALSARGQIGLQLRVQLPYFTGFPFNSQH